jgi:hypothetical protein
MPNTYYSGKMGSIAIGGFAFPLDTWTLSSETQAVEVSNFTIPLGQEAYIPNLIGGTIECSGPLTSAGSPDAGYIPGRPTAGQYYVFTLGVGLGLSYSVVALTTSVEAGQDVKEKATLNITAQITPNPNLV